MVIVIGKWDRVYRCWYIPRSTSPASGVVLVGGWNVGLVQRHLQCWRGGGSEMSEGVDDVPMAVVCAPLAAVPGGVVSAVTVVAHQLGGARPGLVVSPATVAARVGGSSCASINVVRVLVT